MNKSLHLPIVVVAVLAIGYFLFSSVTAAPQEALAQCYTSSQNKINELMKNYTPNTPSGRQICNDAFNEANTMRQCVNNVYEQHGQKQTALARRNLNKNNNNPVDETIKKHNSDCAAYPETTIK